MNRTRTVVTPGETRPAPDAEAADTSDAQRQGGDRPIPPAEPLEPTGLPPAEGKATPALKGTLEQQVAAMQAQLNDVLRVNADLAAQLRRDAKPMPEAVKYPTVEAAKAANPDAPVLTDEGWYCPRVTSANPEQQLTASGIAAAVAAGQAAKKA